VDLPAQVTAGALVLLLAAVAALIRKKRRSAVGNPWSGYAG
jgi:hypothetical protein